MGTRDLRRIARDCIQAGLDAVEPGALVDAALRGAVFPGDAGATTTTATPPVTILSVGKAAVAMAAAAVHRLGDRVSGGLVVGPDVAAAGSLGPLRVLQAEHPVPGPGSLAAGDAVAELAGALEAHHQLLCLISGGASALVTLPEAGLTLDDLRETTGLLLRSGAPIDELNRVRKRLDRLKGGGLAAMVAPTPTRILVLSDVVGDRLDVIASAPMTPDEGTRGDAAALLRARGLWERVPGSVRRFLSAESPLSSATPLDAAGGGPVEVVGSNRLAAAAAADAARRLGFDAHVRSTTLEGEAREVGAGLADLVREVRAATGPIRPPACVVLAGETTVTVNGSGRGGPNQEVALGAAAGLAGLGGVLVAAVGTDGRDGPTSAAGAWADGTTLERAAALDLDSAGALAENDAYPFFEALGDLVVTGPTGTNVMDLIVVLVDAP